MKIYSSPALSTTYCTTRTKISQEMIREPVTQDTETRITHEDEPKFGGFNENDVNTLV